MKRIKTKKYIMDENDPYLNKIRSHLVTIAPIASFTPKSASKLKSALHIRYLIVILSFISPVILFNSNNHYIHVFITLLITRTLFIVTKYCAL